ncbi:MAG: CoA-binding protein [Nitrospiraceae bacterium]|nr:CoA-binding protein [Nitrospiraceae bacterium]
MSLRPLFRPRSIALVGAAHTEAKLGGVVLRNLLKFRGKVYPVNPKYDELMGIRTYRAVKDIPEPVDLALVLRPAGEVLQDVRDFKDRAQCVIIMSSGFAEIGEAALQEEVKRTAAELGIRLLGPNCMGVYNPHHRLDTLFLPKERLPRPKKGNVALVSQSGAVLSCLLTAVDEANTGISKAVGYGNAIDIDESELFDYLAGDSQTGVVVSYIESVGDGRRFVGAARRLADRKPLIVLKAGKGTSGQAAAYSHTGRLAGSYEVFHSILRQFGIREAVDFDALMDAAKALAYQKGLRGKRVLVVTNGGGSGVLAVDECLKQGLEVVPLSGEKKERMKGHFPNFFSVNNPIDLTAQVTDKDYVTAMCALSDDYDGFLVIALPNVLGITEGLAGLLADCRKTVNKPLVCNIPPGGIGDRLTRLLERVKIPVYPSPERAVRGLKALLE